MAIVLHGEWATSTSHTVKSYGVCQVGREGEGHWSFGRRCGGKAEGYPIVVGVQRCPPYILAGLDGFNAREGD